jgi:16S rRNA processing protein RimM
MPTSEAPHEQPEAEQPSASQPAFLVLGQIQRPHGVRGEMRLRVITAYPDRIAHLETVFIGTDPYDADAAQSFSMINARWHREHLLVKLDGIPDRDEAERYRNQFLMVALDDAIPLEDDEYYVFQIIGAKMVTEDGETLGSITQVLETGANDVFVVTGGIRGEVLIPDLPHVILNVDLEQQIVTVAPPPGLLSD